MADQEARTLVGYKVDQSSVAAAVSSAERVKVAYADLKASADQVGLSVNELARRLNVDVVNNNKQVAQTNSQVANSNDRVADSYRKVATEADKAARAQRGGGIQSGFGTVRSLGSAAGQLTGQGELGGAVSAFAGLGVELGVVGVAIAGLAVGLRVLTSEVEKQTKVMSARLDIERSGAREIASLTTQGIEDRLKAARAQLEIDEEVSKQQTVNSLLYNLSIVDQPLKLGAALAGLDPVYNAYQDALAKNAVAIEGSEALVNIYTDALNNNAGALNTATEAALAAAERALDIDRMTREQRNEEAARIQRDIELLVEQAYAAGKTSDAGKQLIAQIDALKEDYKDLTATGETYADMLEREAAAKELVTTQYDNYLKAMDEEIAIREEIADTIAKINSIIAERDEKLLELANDRNERRIEIQQEYEERLQEIARDSAERIGKIMRDAGREQFAAVAERDAKAFYLSQIRAKDALDDQRKADQKAEDNLRRHNDKQLAQLDKSYQKQVDQLYKSSQKQIDIQQQALQQQQVDLMNAQAALAAIALNGSGGRVVIETNMWTELNSVAVTWAANTVNTVRSILIGVVTGSGGGGSGGNMPGVAGGFSSAAFNRAVDNRISQTLTFARTGRAFG